jgi:hypothetical protein
VETCCRLTIAVDGLERLMQGSTQKSGVRSQTRHPESLFKSLMQIFDAGGEQPTVFTGGFDCVLRVQDLLGDSRAFPLTAETCRRREVSRSKEEDVNSVDFAHLGDIWHCRHAFNQWHD